MIKSRPPARAKPAPKTDPLDPLGSQDPLAVAAASPKKAAAPPPISARALDDIITVTAVGDAPGSVRLIFPASQALADRIDAEWHRRKANSRSETIRVLLGEALAILDEGAPK